MRGFRIISRMGVQFKYRGAYFLAVFGVDDKIYYAFSKRREEVKKEMEAVDGKQYCYVFCGINRRLFNEIKTGLPEKIRLNGGERVKTVEERRKTLESFTEQNL